MSSRDLYGKASLATLREDVDFLRAHDLRAEVYLPAHMLDSLDSSLLDLLAEEAGLGRMPSFHAPFIDLSPGGMDQKVLEVTRHRFSQVMELAGEIKPVNVVFHPGYDQWRYGFQEKLWLENSAAIWSEVTEWGEKAGVRPVLENVFDVRPDHLVELRDMVGGPLGFCFDTGHFLLFSEVKLGAWLTGFGDHLAELHLHDNTGNRDVHMPVGEGEFDFTSLLVHTESLHSQPLCVLEHHTHDETVRSLENFLAMTGE
jgi:sugar phosphate isomerase/epimerase